MPKNRPLAIKPVAIKEPGIVQVTAPDLTSQANEVAIESLEINPEGLTVANDDKDQ